MDGLSKELNRANTGCLSGGTLVNHLMYADDLVVFCPSAAGMSKLLKICEQYGQTHDIKYNSKKSAMLICRNNYVKDVAFDIFHINNEVMKETNSVKYLGHLISNDFKDDMDIMRQCRQLYARGNILS